MANPNDDTGFTPKKRPMARILSTILFGLMSVSLLSFGVGGFGGTTTRIGQVGERDIKVNDYVTALRNTVDQFSQMIGQPVTMQQAISAGLDKQALADVVARAALDGEMQAAGLSVDDAAVAAELVKIKAFQSIDGKFDRTAYAEALKSASRTEAEFEAGLRADLARGIAQAAVANGNAGPAALTETLFSYAGETRDLTWLPLTEADLPTAIPAPTEADLQGEYDTNIAAYTRPEAKRISYVALLPDDIAATLPVDEAALKALYDARADQYIVPEKRLVERLVYADDAAATAAKAQLDAGTSFDDLVAARKLTLDDIDLGDVSKSDLGAAGDAVFAMTTAGVVGPLKSDLGPALFRMNAILPAQETTLEEARPDLALELQLEQARKDIAARIESIDDALAGGATLDDLAATEKLTVKSTDYAAGADDNDDIAKYTAFRKAADALAMGDFPEATLLEDGGVIAMAMLETVPPTPRPVADVKDALTAAWHAKQLAAALTAEGNARLAKAAAGTDLATLGAAKTTAAANRATPIEGASAALLTAAFAAKAGDTVLVDEGGFTALLRVDAVTPAKDDAAARTALQGQLDQSIGADVFDIYTKSIQSATTLTLDQTVINSIHTQMGN